MWTTSTGFQVWLLDPNDVGHGLRSSSGGFALPLQLGDRLFAADPMQYGSAGQGEGALSWVVVAST
jgi:hypothetical protein